MRQSLVMIGLALALAGAARAEKTCQLRQIGELPVTVDGQATVEARIDGQPARMMIDTGSAMTLLTRPTARRLGLALRQYRGVEFYGIGGKEPMESARLKEFKVGDMVARDYDMVVTGGENLGDAQGLLGAYFLLQADVEFDFPDGKVRFFKPQDCQGDQVVYWGKAYSVVPMVGTTNNEIEISVLLNGKPTPAEMDTGMPATLVTLEGAAKAGVTPTSDGVSAAGRLGGMGPNQVKVFAGVFSTFAFGDETIRNARLEIADPFHDDKDVPTNSHIGVSAVEEPRMLLGADFFRSHRVYVARGQRKVYVSYVGGPVFSGPTAPPAAK